MPLKVESEIGSEKVHWEFACSVSRAFSGLFRIITQYFYMWFNFIIVAHSRICVLVPSLLILVSMVPGTLLLHHTQLGSSPALIQSQNEFTLGNYRIFAQSNGLNVTSNSTWVVFSPTFFTVNHGKTTYYSTISVSGKWNNQSKAVSLLLSFQTADGNITFIAIPSYFGSHLQLQPIGGPNAGIALNFTTKNPLNATLSGGLQASNFNRNSSDRNVLSNYIYQMYENLGNGSIWISWMQYTYSATTDYVLYSIYSTHGGTATLSVMLKGLPASFLEMELG